LLARIPLGAPSTQTLPGHRTQELSLKDIVAHISKVDLPAVVIGPASKAGDATLIHPPAHAGFTELAQLEAQVRALKAQMDELAHALEERERELAEAKDQLHGKQLALEKADRERKAAETAIQRLSMQLASRR
jgi:DNA repair exonuclease SbcCD ATPase subunit